MANTAKKTTTAKPKENVEKKSNESNEISALKKQNEDLQAQMNQLMQMLTEQNQSTPQNTAEKATPINSDEEILVVSLVPHELNLSTEMFGKGNKYVFRSLGEEQEIPYGDLRDIIRVHRNIAENGIFYIVDENIVQKLRMKQHYQRLLEPSQMIEILTLHPEKVVELYKLAPEGQQDTIIEMIVQKKLDRQKIDANILMELGQLCNKDLMSIENLEDE